MRSFEVRTDASYLKYMAPPSDKDGKLAEVKISVNVLGVLEINEMGHYVAVYYYLRQEQTLVLVNQIMYL
jgi:hypothetical protein